MCVENKRLYEQLLYFTLQFSFVQTNKKTHKKKKINLIEMPFFTTTTTKNNNGFSIENALSGKFLFRIANSRALFLFIIESNQRPSVFFLASNGFLRSI